jgi:hypothetical protein
MSADHDRERKWRQMSLRKSVGGWVGWFFISNVTGSDCSVVCSSLSPLVSARVFLYKELQMEHLRTLKECCSDNQAQALRELR